jgi:hypothetical protein
VVAAAANLESLDLTPPSPSDTDLKATPPFPPKMRMIQVKLVACGQRRIISRRDESETYRAGCGMDYTAAGRARTPVRAADVVFQSVFGALGTARSTSL